MGAYWKQLYYKRTGDKMYGHFALVVPVLLRHGKPTTVITSHVARVKEKTDGRWEFTLWGTKMLFTHYNGGVPNTQGVRPNACDAMTVAELALVAAGYTGPLPLRIDCIE